MSGKNSVVVPKSSWARPAVPAAAVLVMLLLSHVSSGLAQGQRANPQGPFAGFPDLVGGLKATPGCLGVETARTTSGKNVIFAWFQDKQAVLKWYYSDVHQGAMKMAFPNHKPGAPLQGVPDNSGPILAIAALTLADKPHFEGMTLPISQISIELYQPITGGIFLGGRFAPDSLPVPNMRDYTPRVK